MKEVRFFFDPNAPQSSELPDDEAMHALRVLRLKSGDEFMLMDGIGNYYRCEVTLAATKKCMYRVVETLPQEPLWYGDLNIAIGPTKMMDRMEWLVEKGTEIGFNGITFVNCKNSERRVVKTTRLEKIIVSATKQSHKPWKPTVSEILPFKSYIDTPVEGRKYIAHCYEDMERTDLYDELLNAPVKDEKITVLIGPEGDFDIEEVNYAIEKGWMPVSLGRSRLRTETAGLSAIMMMNLAGRRIDNNKEN
ncbi:MAG: 16S rRNA (uracil(1498)-N(3))-methyltransferase [Prevotella sp.]|nr:16S rRNA (uracil(1498)-N(3))-methyltransferase [Prevotella sp.]